MAQTRQPTTVDVAIIGGGLVGASLACALGDLIEAEQARANEQARADERESDGEPRAPLRVAIIEPQPLPSVDEVGAYQPSFDARASAIAHGSRRHFEQLKVWPTMREQASPIRHIHVSERGHLGATRLHADELGVEALGYVIPNAWMGRALHARLDRLPIDWHCPARVETLEPAHGGYRLTLDTGEIIQAGLTVLADGGRSGFKERLGIESDHHPYQQTALIANVEMSRAHDGWAFERFTQEGPMALLPLTGRRMELVWTHEQGDIEEALALPDSLFLDRLQRAFGDRAGRFRRVGQRHAYPLSLITARETIRPHLAILGNAAHSLHPVAGQGFNLALRGVMDLAAAIETARANGRTAGDARTLAAFEASRTADTHRIVRFSDGLIRLFGIDHAVLGYTRAAGLVGLNALGPLRRTLARRAMGIER
ncbi:2-octaprenyl-6-methoxyphenyl hydroxylase [Salinicola sp. MH3R3-1]|uniref:2-octaprenyl-6-methoxyphenyl hydroxylase n=1 Tax=Salinicola sp. MH3R3-1 TaxID=1928762 RepID=UPI00094E1837|nr:2-octaprenyl-6-methoxyphenyl hydroxylase [Salinicola sp. MH3R3-1]OLO08655.1 2-octaprenyl-6-methoxyphenyl hydroxylase [Salinicola sp. MH3R3-1]